MAPFVEDENNVAATNGTSRPDSSTTNGTTNGTTSGTTNNQKIPDPNGITLSQLPENHDPLQPYKIDKFDDGLRYDTLQIHGGHRPDKETHARAVPIYNSVVCMTLKFLVSCEIRKADTNASPSFSLIAIMLREFAQPKRVDISTVESPT
jgi:hypothetical protein